MKGKAFCKAIIAHFRYISVVTKEVALSKSYIFSYPSLSLLFTESDDEANELLSNAFDDDFEEEELEPELELVLELEEVIWLTYVLFSYPFSRKV